MTQIDWNILRPVDVGERFQQGYQGAQRNALMQREQAYQNENRAAQTEQRRMATQERQIIIGAQLLDGVTDDAGFQSARQTYARLGFDLAGIPEQFDPNYVQSVVRAGRALQSRGRQTEATPFQRDLQAAGIMPGTPQFRQMLENRYAPPPIPVRNDDGTTTLYPRPAAPAQPTFQDGQRETINGIPYIRQGGQWVPETGQAAPVATPSAVDMRPVDDPAPAFHPAPQATPAGPTFRGVEFGNPLAPEDMPRLPQTRGGVGGPFEAGDGGGGGGGGGQPILTDEDVARARGSQQPQQDAYTIGTPSQARQAEQARQEAANRRAEESLALARDAAARADRAEARAGIPAGYRRSASGDLEPIPGGPADPARATTRIRPLPDSVGQRIQDGTSGVLSLNRALRNFRDDYAGNFLGNVENTMQRYVGGGTPGQSQFWSDVSATDNIARNALFGASLTEGEKSAWEATTVNPRMRPEEVRANLSRRLEIARSALQRLARTARANGYNPEAIEAALGELSSIVAEGGGADDVSSPLVPLPNESSQQLWEALQQAPPGSTARFRMLERYYRYRQQTPRPALVAIEGMEPADGMGVTAEQGRQLLEEYEREQPLQEARDSREQFARDHPVLANVDTVVRTGANAMTLGYADRLAGGDPFLTGANQEGVAREHAITRSDWENRPVASLGGTLAGGMALPMGRTIPRQMGAGAAYGGAYEFNATDGSFGDRTQNALLGAGTGAGTAWAIGGGLRAMGRGGGPPTNAHLVQQAAQRQGVDIMPADIGGPMTRRLTGGTGQTVFGAGPVVRGAQRTEAQVGGRLNDLAVAEGAPLRQEVLGDRLRSSLESFNARSGEYGRNLYANARDLAEGVPLRGAKANQALTRNIDELQATANTDAPLISGLQRLQADIAPNGVPAQLTVDQMRRLRTTVRSEAQTEGLRATDYQRRAGEVLDALSDDIAEQLPPAAAREFREADRLWRARLDFIDDVENSILGPKNDRSAESVARRLLSMTRGDSARFRRVLDTVSAEESGMIRGSAIQELGRAADGSPNAGGFSLDRFLTNYEALPERSRALLFRGQSMADVEDLLTIARARREAAQYINRSQTGGSVNVSQLVDRSNQAVQNASAIGAWGTVGLTAILENLTGRLLASQRFVRLLARPPRDPNRAMRALRRIAITEPGLRDNIDTIFSAMTGGGQQDPVR